MKKKVPFYKTSAPAHLVSGVPLCTALSGHLEPTVQKINDLRQDNRAADSCLPDHSDSLRIYQSGKLLHLLILYIVTKCIVLYLEFLDVHLFLNVNFVLVKAICNKKKKIKILATTSSP